MASHATPLDVLAGTARWCVAHGDSREILRSLPDESVDAVVCDPPAGIAFMGRKFDSDRGGRDEWIAWLSEIMREALRVTKPGGHAFVWSLPRTNHWTATAVENAGWEIRDVAAHCFGTGFPKSLSVSAAIDAHLGAERPVVGTRTFTGTAALSIEEKGGTYSAGIASHGASREVNVTGRATDEAKRWEGYGTALKPAVEFWILARRPLGMTVAECVLKHGTGALNIAATRVTVSASRTVRACEGDGSAPSGARCASAGNGRSRGSDAASPAHVRDALRRSASALRSCSSACTVPWPSEARRDDTWPWAEGSDERLACPLPPSGGVHGQRWTEAPDCEGGCLAFARSCGGLIRRAVSGGPDASASLADALERIAQELQEPGRILRCRCIDTPLTCDVLHGLALLAQDVSARSVERQDGRWPSSLLLSHSPGCKHVGTKQVKTGTAADPGSASWFGTRESPAGKRGYTDAQRGKRPGGFGNVGAESGDEAPNGPVYDGRYDGSMETVDEWVCQPECAVHLLDESVGERTSGMMAAGQQRTQGGGYHGGFAATATATGTYGDSGTVSRFFNTFEWDPLDSLESPLIYVPKASRSEREQGCDALPEYDATVAVGRDPDSAGAHNPRAGAGRTATAENGVRNLHPTVKTIALMRHLVRLVTPPGGVVLDPFAGSGSTGIACMMESNARFIGIELNNTPAEPYVDIARARISYVAGGSFTPEANRSEAPEGTVPPAAVIKPGQQSWLTKLGIR